MRKLFVLLAILGAFFGLTACGSSSAPAKVVTVQQAAPQEMNLQGDWHSTSGMQGVTFTAHIYPDSIQIESTFSSGASGIFWMGSFDAGAGPWGKITSLPDQDAMATQIFASQETSKVFTYNDGDLSFDYSIMGVHSTIHMSRS